MEKETGESKIKGENKGGAAQSGGLGSNKRGVGGLKEGAVMGTGESEADGGEKVEGEAGGRERGREGRG